MTVLFNNAVSVRGLALLLAVLVVMTACARTSKQQAADPGRPGSFSGDGNSAYCRLAAKWTAHELRIPPGDSGTWPQYMRDYLAYTDDTARVAPVELKNATRIRAAFIRDVQLPVLRKYGYSPNRVDREGKASDREKAFHLPADVAGAADRIRYYDSQVCGTGNDYPREAKYTGSRDSAYCKVVIHLRVERFTVSDAGFPPAATRKFYVETYAPALDQLVSSAPPGRRSDVAATASFAKSKQLPTLARFGFDVRKILTQGTAVDRSAAYLSAPEVLPAAARNTSYDEQICTDV